MDPDDFAARATKQPVYKLSPEVLSNIFIEYAALLPNPSKQQHSLCPVYLKWIAATYVCRYWRSVALGCTTLWRRLVFFNPEVTKEMIRRAKGSNLEVRIKGLIPQKLSAVVDEALRMVIPELYHISTLHLQLHKHLLQPLVDGFASAAPNLECILLRPLHEDKIHVPDTIFAQKMPALRSLELEYCTLMTPSPSSSTSDPHLVHIPSTMSQIVSYIRRMPTLHTLTLTEVLPEEMSADTVYPKLALPELSNLTLTGSITSCINFLERLVLPLTTATYIDCKRLSQNANYHRLFRSFRTAIGNGEGDLAIHALVITPRRVTSLSGSGFRLHYALAHRHSSPRTIVTFSFHCWDPYPGMFEDVLSTASRTISQTDIHDLLVDAFDDSDYSDWISGVRHHLPNIPNICLSKMRLRDFIIALGDRDSPMLPHLRNLLFIEVYFWPQDVQLLLNCLESRFLSGMPIKAIHLSDCIRLFEPDVRRMEKFVQLVDWDGHEEDDDDDDDDDEDYNVVFD